MTKHTTVIVHNNKEYLLNIGSSFKNLDSDPVKAIYEICVEERWSHMFEQLKAYL